MLLASALMSPVTFRNRLPTIILATGLFSVLGITVRRRSACHGCQVVKLDLSDFPHVDSRGVGLASSSIRSSATIGTRSLRPMRMTGISPRCAAS
jgi:ABC-type transporter Mla MlaB component